MKYYKVVMGNLQSCRTQNLDFITQYRVGEWVEPQFKGSKLFVFDDLEAAKRFVWHWSSEKIYECEVEGVYKGKLKFLLAAGESLRSLWSKVRNKGKVSHLLPQSYDEQSRVGGGYIRDVFNHTVWVKKVKLIKQVN